MNKFLESYVEVAILAGMSPKETSKISGMTQKDIIKKENRFIKHSAPKLARLAKANEESDEELKKLKVYSVILGKEFFLWQIGELELPLDKEIYFKSFLSGSKSQYDSLRYSMSKQSENKERSLMDDISELVIKTKSVKDFPHISDLEEDK